MGNTSSTKPNSIGDKPTQLIIHPSASLCSDEDTGHLLLPHVKKNRPRMPRIQLSDWILLLRREQQIIKKAELLVFKGAIPVSLLSDCKKLTDIEQRARKLNYHPNVLPVSKIVKAPPAPPPSPPRKRRPFLTVTARMRMENARRAKTSSENSRGNMFTKRSIHGSVPSNIGTSALSCRTSASTRSLSVTSLKSTARSRRYLKEYRQDCGFNLFASQGHYRSPSGEKEKIAATNRLLHNVSRKLKAIAEENLGQISNFNNALFKIENGKIYNLNCNEAISARKISNSAGKLEMTHNDHKHNIGRKLNTNSELCEKKTLPTANKVSKSSLNHQVSRQRSDAQFSDRRGHKKTKTSESKIIVTKTSQDCTVETVCGTSVQNPEVKNVQRSPASKSKFKFERRDSCESNERQTDFGEHHENVSGEIKRCNRKRKRDKTVSKTEQQTVTNELWNETNDRSICSKKDVSSDIGREDTDLICPKDSAISTEVNCQRALDKRDANTDIRSEDKLDTNTNLINVDQIEGKSIIQNRQAKPDGKFLKCEGRQKMQFADKNDMFGDTSLVIEKIENWVAKAEFEKSEMCLKYSRHANNYSSVTVNKQRKREETSINEKTSLKNCRNSNRTNGTASKQLTSDRCMNSSIITKTSDSLQNVKGHVDSCIGLDLGHRGNDTPKVGSDTPKVGSDTPKVGNATPKVGSDTPKVGNDTPKVGSDTPKVGNATPKVGSDTPKVGSEARCHSVIDEQRSDDQTRPVTEVIGEERSHNHMCPVTEEFCDRVRMGIQTSSLLRGPTHTQRRHQAFQVSVDRNPGSRRGSLVSVSPSTQSFLFTAPARDSLSTKSFIPVSNSINTSPCRIDTTHQDSSYGIERKISPSQISMSETGSLGDHRSQTPIIIPGSTIPVTEKIVTVTTNQSVGLDPLFSNSRDMIRQPNRPRLYYAEPLTQLDSRPSSTMSNVQYPQYNNNTYLQPGYNDFHTLRVVPTYPPNPNEDILPHLNSNNNFVNRSSKRWRLTQITSSEEEIKKLPRVTLVKYRLEGYCNQLIQGSNNTVKFHSSDSDSQSPVNHNSPLIAPGRKLSVITNSATRILKVIEATPMTPVTVAPNVTQFLFPDEIQAMRSSRSLPRIDSLSHSAHEFVSSSEEYFGSCPEGNTSESYTQTDRISTHTQTDRSLSRPNSNVFYPTATKRFPSRRRRLASIGEGRQQTNFSDDGEIWLAGGRVKKRSSSIGANWRT